MAQCTQCGATILFGGHRFGEYRFCSARCVVLGRPLLLAQDRADTRGDEGELTELREHVGIIIEELQQQRVAIGELQERIDFLERALAQVRTPKISGGAT
jgi:hypothetical protein